MVFWYVAPEPTVFGPMSIIAHHPIIILFKGIGLGNFAIDQYLIAIYFKGIALVFLYYLLVNGQNFQIKGYGLTFFGNIYGIHIVYRTRMVGILRENGGVLVGIGKLLNGDDAIH